MPDLFGALNLPALFTGILGETVTFTPLGGAPVSINAIVEWNSLIVNSFDASTNASSVVAHVRGQDVGRSPEGARIATAVKPFLPATTWKIVQPIVPDGQGMTMVTLALVEAAAATFDSTSTTFDNSELTMDQAA